MDEFIAIARLLDALRPWLGHLVVVGGWAHRLYRFHERASPSTYAVLRTKDADVAFSADAPLEGDIAAALKAAGFSEVSSLDLTPPITRYRLGDDDGGFYAEFLAPLRGSPTKRKEKVDATIAKAGVTAQNVRYMDLLLVHPWPVQLSEAVGVPLRSPLEVMVPNPVSFIAQKLLIRKLRTREKQAQDALYIHDTLELFGGELSILRKLWREHVRPTLPGRTARSVEELCGEQFGVVDDVIRSAVRLPQDRLLLPVRFQATCIYGLDQVFGRTGEIVGAAP